MDGSRPTNALVPGAGARRRERGSVLITALTFLVVLTMVAVTAMRTTVLDFKMTTNTMLEGRAFEHSEIGFGWMTPVLDGHVMNSDYEPAWPGAAGGNVPDAAAFALPAGLSICPCPAGPPDDVWVADNVPLGDYSAEDMQYRLDGNGDGDFDDPVDVASDLFVTRLHSIRMVGAAAGSSSGYEGVGKGDAGAGTALFFDVRSRGASLDGARTLIGGDIRVVIR